MRFLGINTKAASSGTLQALRSWNRRRLAQRSAKIDAARAPDSLCVIGIFKNEKLALEEWIKHYLWQGADKIILIDNGSTDSSYDKIKPWLEAGVSYIRLDRPYRQREHYWTAIKKFNVRKNWKWLLIADLDEFWFVKNGQSLRSKLPDYQGLDVVYCNWSNFGCPDDAPHPNSLRTELLLRHPELGPNVSRKYLVRANKLRKLKMVGVHTIKGLDSARTVSDNTNLQMNHYRTQSRHFWTEVKMTRGDAYYPAVERVRVLEEFKK